MDERLEDAKERAWRELRSIDEAHERGSIDDERWHRAMADLVVPAYLAAKTAQGGSGHSGTAAEWEHSRGIVADALDRSGALLDVGCANGLLMQSVHRWAAAKQLTVEPYGLEIAPELAELARRRCPGWSARIFVGNALGWQPPERFDFVRTSLDHVPRQSRRALLEHLLDCVVAPGGRLIVGKFNEELETRALEREVASWGLRIGGRAERQHRSEPRLAYRLFWIDAG